MLLLLLRLRLRLGRLRRLAASADGRVIAGVHPPVGVVRKRSLPGPVIAQAATLTTDVLRDASGALLASQSIDVEVWTPGAGATQLWSGQIATDAAGIGTVTNNNMGAVGDTVDIRFPGLQNSFNSVRYILQ